MGDVSYIGNVCIHFRIHEFARYKEFSPIRTNITLTYSQIPALALAFKEFSHCKLRQNLSPQVTKVSEMVNE